MMIIAGVDEAGRGPLAGPVVAAAVILNPNFPILGLDDSKKLNASKREALFTLIMRDHHVAFAFVPAAEIDRINIRQATLLAMRRAVLSLAITPDEVLVDGRDAIPGIDSRAIIGGDALNQSISAASIVAKVIRDRMMVKLDASMPDYGFARHKGYGTRKHIEAIQTHGTTDYHRQSFAKAA
jgi:ribonuclease HII